MNIAAGLRVAELRDGIGWNFVVRHAEVLLG
jgi:hypothetical protein